MEKERINNPAEKKKIKKSKIWLNRIWFLSVITATSYLCVYFDLNPGWALIASFIIIPIPFLVSIHDDIHDAAKRGKIRPCRARRLKGFIGYLPVYDDED
jgi:cytochrome c oxidase subunit IV